MTSTVLFVIMGPLVTTLRAPREASGPLILLCLPSLPSHRPSLAKRIVIAWLARVPAPELRTIVSTAFQNLPEETIAKVVPFALAFVERAGKRRDGLLNAVVAEDDAWWARREDNFFFSALDRNKDGVVDMKEFEQSGEMLGLSSAEEARELFRRLDTNRDGVLSRQEFAMGEAVQVPRRKEKREGGVGPEGDVT